MVKRVAVINDLSGMGKCSLTAAIPVLSVMGLQACPLPTAVLSNQTDYDSYYSMDYTDHMDSYINEWKKLNISFDGIYTGYLGSEKQAEKILHFIDYFQQENTLLLVDPVMGDNGKTYDVYTDSFGRQMKRLVKRADVITPNLTELCILTDTDYEELTSWSASPDYLEKIAEIGKPLLAYGIQTIIITGILYQAQTDSKPKYCNIVLEPGDMHVVSSEIHGESYSGTGDLMASIVCGGIVRGESAVDSVRKAAHFLEVSLKETQEEKIPRNDGINFESYLKLLL